MNVYIGTFLIAFTTLGLEICFTRLLSVTTWYHLAFFAISTAMLGMTAGAVTVYVKPRWFAAHNLSAGIATACLGYAVATPLSLLMLCILPLTFTGSAMNLVTMALATVFCSLPFYFSGIAMAAVLTKHPLPIGKLYSSDLVGASMGCLAVLAGVEILDVPSLILLFGAVGILAAYGFAWHLPNFAYRRASGWILGLLVLVACVNTMGPAGIAPVVVKGKIENPSDFFHQEWNSFSRVVVHKGGRSVPQLWGASPLMPPQPPVIQHWMNVDGDAGTTIRRFSSTQDIYHLAYDLTNVAYHLRGNGGACVIGVGGGRDVHSAILFGHERILGIEVNPIFIELLQEEFRDFAALADDARVQLVVDEARSYLSNSEETFSVIQMSLIDTWAATGAGAFSLSENALYTVDGWKVFLRRLSKDGIFTVSRWYSPQDLGETGRVASLAVAVLLETGAADPARHVAMLTTGRISTTLVAKSPFSDEDIETLHQVSSRLGYDLVISPDGPPNDPMLKKIPSVRSMSELKLAVADARFNYEPPTDDNPYFFNMLRLSRLSEAFGTAPGIIRGNLTATITLLVLIFCLVVLAVVTIVLPLAITRRGKADLRMLWPGAAYFSLIGAGFMFVEIALIQRLSVFLGHPVYALGILLFTIIASAGLGSLLSERMRTVDRWWPYALPIMMVIAIIGARYLLPIFLTELSASARTLKILASVALISPLGLLMGFFFPCGMRLVRRASADDTPWYWALNGILGVLCSALAVFISIYFGIAMNLFIAAACYGMLVFCVNGLRATARREVGGLSECPPVPGVAREVPGERLVS